MVTIKITEAESMFKTNLKSVNCPACGGEIKSWSYPVTICRFCNGKLVNANDLVNFIRARFEYHQEGPY